MPIFLTIIQRIFIFMHSLLYNSFKNAIKRDKAELAQVLASVSILFKKLRTEFVEKPAHAGKK